MVKRNERATRVILRHLVKTMFSYVLLLDHSSLALRPALSTGAKPHLTVTWAHPPSNFMFASVLGLADIPLEILEHVFLHLPGQDVIKMEAVRRPLADPRKSSLTFVARSRSADASGPSSVIPPLSSTDASSSPPV